MMQLNRVFEIKISKKNIDYKDAVQLMQKRVESILYKKEKIKPDIAQARTVTSATGTILVTIKIKQVTISARAIKAKDFQSDLKSGTKEPKRNTVKQ